MWRKWQRGLYNRWNNPKRVLLFSKIRINIIYQWISFWIDKFRTTIEIYILIHIMSIKTHETKTHEVIDSGPYITESSELMALFYEKVRAIRDAGFRPSSLWWIESEFLQIIDGWDGLHADTKLRLQWYVEQLFAHTTWYVKGGTSITHSPRPLDSHARINLSSELFKIRTRG